MSIPQSGWHLDDRLLAAYAGGALEFAAEASVEAHLLACGQCRTLLAPAVDRRRLDHVWDEVLDRIDAPRPTFAERVLRRLGVAESTARLLAATPSLTASWVVSIAFALCFALAAAHVAPSGVLLFLVLAPVLPVAGVAAAYGAGVDPTHDIGLAAPYSSFRLLLLRTAAVVVTTGVLAGVAAAFLPAAVWLAAAWLLPALALTGTTLALSMRLDAVWTAAAVATLWVTVVITAYRATGVLYAAFSAVGQLTCLAVAVLSLAVVLGRHRAADLDLRRNS